MKRATIASILVVVSFFAISTAGSAVAQPTDKQPKHSIRVKGVLSAAEELAKRECDSNAACIAYAWGPCNRVSRHKADCVVHNITGTAGDQATQQDCHREVRFSIKNFSTKLFFRFLGEFACAPNQEHPGF